MKDKRYSFALSLIDHFRDKMEFKNGCRINRGGKTAIVNSDVLAAFFNSNNFPINKDDDETTLDGFKYRESYIKGFIEGQEYFKRTYSSGNPYDERFIADLFVQYNHLGYLGAEGWSFVKYGYPVIISHEIIKEWGYYGGIVFEFEDLLHKYPSMGIEDIKSLRDTLQKACKGEREYESIRSWFIKEGWCDRGTFIWRTERKVSGYKSILAYYLRDLHIKGYTKDVSYLEIKAIAKNSFGITIDIEIIKKSKKKHPTLPDIPIFKQSQ